MSVWERYDKEQREEYIKFLQIYGALTNLFKQKKGDLIPYLDSKFQETVFARVFNSQNVDIGNTPHDVLSIFGDLRIGIGLKTWQNTAPSYQKVMQLKRYKNEIEPLKRYPEDLAFKISQIKNARMISDYRRLGLNEDQNIYHYVTRDDGRFVIQECSYPLINLNALSKFILTETSLNWTDGQKEYKYTFGDSQIWQKFDPDSKDNFILSEFKIDILDDPFDFLLKSYSNLVSYQSTIQPENEFIEVYLPLYSYRTQEVERKSGLNAWNAAPKNKGSDSLRPLNEIYIPVPIEFHRKNPDFFCKDIFSLIKAQKEHTQGNDDVRFHFVLPNGKRIPGLLTGDNMKNLQSGSKYEIDLETGRPFGQSALGQWLLVDVLGLSDRTLVTREWLNQRDTDSVKLWRKKDDYSTIYIDFAPVGAFERFINNETNFIESE